MDNVLSWDEFKKVDIRVGTIVSVEYFKEARSPAYKIIVDFGHLGKRKTSAQITELYSENDLEGKQVLAVINFPKKQIANMMSECLILGIPNEQSKDVVIIQPERKVKEGLRIS